MGEATKEGADSRARHAEAPAKAITAADVPRTVQDQIVVGRIREATGSNLGRAAREINAFYYGTDAKRPEAELAVGDALGVNQDAFGVVVEKAEAAIA